MRRLDRYIARSVLSAVLAVLLVLVALVAIADLIDQLEELRGNYDFVAALQYVGYTLPKRLYENIPFAALVGCLIGLGLLASSSELTIMRAAGVSIGRITWAVLKPVLLVVALGIAIGEYVAPLSEQIGESKRALLQTGQKALESRRGLWNREGDEFMHFNAVLPRGVLFGVTRYQFDDQGRLRQTSFAERATYLGDYWQLERGAVTRFTSEGTQTEQFTVRRWNTSLSPALLNVVVLEPEELAMRSLFRYARYLDDQGIESSEHWLAFWQKLWQPAATASLVLIAVSFVFGPLRQATMGYRIFVGVIVGVVFQISQDLLGPASLVFGFPPLWAVVAPIAVSLALGLLLLRRAG